MCGFGTDDCRYDAGAYRNDCGPDAVCWWDKIKKKTGVLDTWQITANQE